MSILTLSTGTDGVAPRTAPISDTNPKQSRVCQTLGGLASIKPITRSI